MGGKAAIQHQVGEGEGQRHMLKNECSTNEGTGQDRWGGPTSSPSMPRPSHGAQVRGRGNSGRGGGQGEGVGVKPERGGVSSEVDPARGPALSVTGTQGTRRGGRGR